MVLFQNGKRGEGNPLPPPVRVRKGSKTRARNFGKKIREERRYGRRFQKSIKEKEIGCSAGAKR
jgi:hypothetical protein